MRQFAPMIGDLSDLRESLLAARLLREQIAVAPVRPDDRAALAAWVWRENAAAWGGSPCPSVVLCPGAAKVARPELARLASLLDGGSANAVPRRGPGDAFQGRAAPAPSAVSGLLGELLDTVNAPVAIESWAPPVRAFVLHFLIRLVQPLTCASRLGPLAEAWLLAADGFSPALVKRRQGRLVACPR